MSERFVRIGIEIPLSLYANLDKIKNGSAASGRILEAVKKGYDAKAINIAIRALETMDRIKFNVYALNELLKDVEDDNNG